jgi:hypothetical protein
VNESKRHYALLARTRISVLVAMILLQVNLALAVEPVAAPSPVQTAAPLTTGQAPQPRVPFALLERHSLNPINAYRGTSVPPPSMVNSTRLSSLVRDGKIYLTLNDAISLALENNLDLVIARYNLPIAQTDVQRTQAGGQVRGVNTGVVPAAERAQRAEGQAQAAHPAAQAALALAHPALCRPRWVPAPRFQRTTPTFSYPPMWTTHPRN